jgi:hypothetical protein
MVLLDFSRSATYNIDTAERRIRMRERYLQLRRNVLDILKKAYPNNKFRVNIGHAGLSDVIIVKTDLVKTIPYEDEMLADDLLRHQPLTPEESERAWKALEQRRRNKEIYHEIERLLLNFLHRSVDPVSGEPLLGGNTYLEVKPLEKSK